MPSANRYIALFLFLLTGCIFANTEDKPDELAKQNEDKYVELILVKRLQEAAKLGHLSNGVDNKTTVAPGEEIKNKNSITEDEKLKNSFAEDASKNNNTNSKNETNSNKENKDSNKEKHEEGENKNGENKNGAKENDDQVTIGKGHLKQLLDYIIRSTLRPTTVPHGNDTLGDNPIQHNSTQPSNNVESTDTNHTNASNSSIDLSSTTHSPSLHTTEQVKTESTTTPRPPTEEHDDVTTTTSTSSPDGHGQVTQQDEAQLMTSSTLMTNENQPPVPVLDSHDYESSMGTGITIALVLGSAAFITAMFFVLTSMLDKQKKREYSSLDDSFDFD